MNTSEGEVGLSQLCNGLESNLPHHSPPMEEHKSISTEDSSWESSLPDGCSSRSIQWSQSHSGSAYSPHSSLEVGSVDQAANLSCSQVPSEQILEEFVSLHRKSYLRAQERPHTHPSQRPSLFKVVSLFAVTKLGRVTQRERHNGTSPLQDFRGLVLSWCKTQHFISNIRREIPNHHQR